MIAQLAVRTGISPAGLLEPDAPEDLIGDVVEAMLDHLTAADYDDYRTTQRDGLRGRMLAKYGGGG